MSGRKRAVGLVRPSKGGRITIPIELREQLGIDEHTDLELSVSGDELRLRPVRERTDSDWLKELYDELAPIRDGMRDLTEDEANALIDEAVAEVRRSRG